MPNYIVIPFAWEEKKRGGVNLSASGSEKKDIYLMNAAVACVSAKKHNQKDHVVFATTLDNTEISEEIRKVMRDAGVEIFTIPYDAFRFSDSYPWSLAFYKLCVLKYMCEKGFDNICYMDSDVYVQESFEAIWEESRYNIMLYDINHGLYVEDYKIICAEFSKFNSDYHYVTHYGGEFFAANYDNARQFVSICEEIYSQMVEKCFVTTKGDEFIISLAAKSMHSIVKNSASYVYRFWTNFNFRLVSTCYRYNRVIVLHMPNEKEKGMIKLYKKFISKGVLPNDSQVWSICHLDRKSFKYYLYFIREKINGSFRRIKN